MDEQSTNGVSSDQPRAESGMGRPGDRLLNFSWMAIGAPFLAVLLLILVFLGGDSTLSAVVTIPTVVLVIVLSVARTATRMSRAQADRQRRAPQGDQAQSGRWWSDHPGRLAALIFVGPLPLLGIIAGVGYAIDGKTGVLVAFCLTIILFGLLVVLGFVWAGLRSTIR